MTTSQTRTWLELRGGDYDGQYHATWPAIGIVAFGTSAPAERPPTATRATTPIALLPRAVQRSLNAFV
jgi:hypothetical protein